jgi:photosystem II stability/assembly factor-like uncharacterized protein
MVQFVGVRTGWAVGSDGIIVATRDGGASWQKQTSGTDESLLGGSFVNALTGWAVGGKGTISCCFAQLRPSARRQLSSCP